MIRPPGRLLRELEEANRLLELGKLNKASLPARRAYALAEKHLPQEHPCRQLAARTLGLLLMNLNQKQEAERLLREAGDLAGAEADDSDIARRNTDVTLRWQAGSTPELACMAEAVLAKAQELLAPESDGVTMAMDNLGKIRESLGDLQAAERLFFGVLRTRRRRGAAPELLTIALLDVARMHLRAGRHVKAEPLYREALQLQEDSGNEGMELAITLNQLSNTCLCMGHYDEAIAHAERGLRLRRESLGQDHPQVAVGLHALAALFMKLERNDEADLALETAWRILDRCVGPKDPRTIQYVMERGMVRLAQGQASLGLEHLRQAEIVAAASLPSHHPLREQIGSVIQSGLELQKKLGT